MSGNGSRLIVARNRPETAPVSLSFAQEQLWCLDEMEGSSAGYNIPYTLRLKGQVDIRAIELALKTVVERHTVLRSAIELDQHGRPQQRVCNVVFRMQTKQVRNDAELRHILAEERARAFKLSDALKIRATLISGPLANESHEEGIEVQGPLSELSTNRRSVTSESILVIVLHHIAGDGWSTGVLCRELSVLYSALRAGSEPKLSPLPIQYADYALWQRSCFNDELLESQLLYWRSQLEGIPALLELPTDYPRPAVQRFRREIEQLKLSAELFERLKLFSLSHGATLDMTLLSAFSVLLSRYRGQEDIVVGSPIANRMLEETEPLIGFLVNTLVLRVLVARDKSFVELLSEVRETTMSAYEHRELPFAKLVEVLRPTSSLSYSPLIQVMFVLQHMPAEPLSLDGLDVDELNHGAEQGYGAAKFDLKMTLVEEVEGGFRSEVSYNADLFKRSTIKRLLGHFEVILEGILADPAQPVSRLPMLTEAERQQLLVGWNTPSARNEHGSLVDLFEAEVERAPERSALRFGDVELSYATINRRSNQLARYLLSIGLASEGVVALFMSRSIDLIVSMVAVLKAGGCYLPLDPEYPAERQLFMLQDAAAFCVLTQEAHIIQANATATRASLPSIAVDAKEALWRNEYDSSIAMMRQSNQLAYIMYTSGSTGTPKGVAVEQTGVIRLVKGANYLPIGPDDVWLQLAPVTFDASTLEIWGALLNGAQLIVMPSSTPSLSLLGQTIKDNGITHLWLTAGLFTLMVDEQLADLSQLKYLLSGGDVLSPERVAKAFEALPGTQIINGYGPTENTTFTTCYPVVRLPEVGVAVPIGKPISGTQVYLLDEYRQLVPVGIEGEIYVGGEGLARHYVNRPDLTASAFVDNPFAAGRLYRTGDRARWRENGIIEYLGRRDHQVKHNGYRIELGEIEAALNSYSEISEAVVLYEDHPSLQRLVAFFVSTNRVDERALRHIMKSQLPEYMVPGIYYQLESIPLTHNGKIDRQALRCLNFTALPNDNHDDLPIGETETALSIIWGNLLNVQQVSRHANFFELGGHSLLAMKLVTQIREKLKIGMPLRRIFECPTLAELANMVDTDKWIVEKTDSSLEELGEEGDL